MDAFILWKRIPGIADWGENSCKYNEVNDWNLANDTFAPDLG